MTQLEDREPQAVAGEVPGRPAPARRSRSVVIWALLGAVWTVICVKAVIGWISGPDFGPAPILGPDHMPAAKLAGLRIVEVVSTGVLLVSIYYLAVRPWRRTGRIPLDAFLLLGGVTGFVMDCWLNLVRFLFAFNSHSINLGSWAGSLPFHHDDVPSNYGESLLWGLPMYIYFCAALGAVGALAARALRRRHPAMSVQAMYAVLFAGYFVFDFVVENLIIRLTDAYAFTQTNGSLTLWAGSQYQFPVYESFFVALVGLAFTYAKLSADDSPDGLSVIERGVNEFPVRLRTPLRALAAIGYCALALLVCYHLPVNWIGVGGHSMAHMASYLMPSS